MSARHLSRSPEARVGTYGVGFQPGYDGTGLGSPAAFADGSGWLTVGSGEGATLAWRAGPAPELGSGVGVTRSVLGTGDGVALPEFGTGDGVTLESVVGTGDGVGVSEPGTGAGVAPFD